MPPIRDAIAVIGAILGAYAALVLVLLALSLSGCTGTTLAGRIDTAQAVVATAPAPCPVQPVDLFGRAWWGVMPHHNPYGYSDSGYTMTFTKEPS